MDDNDLKAMEAGLKKAKEIHGAHPMMTDMEVLIATVRKQAVEIERLKGEWMVLQNKRLANVD